MAYQTERDMMMIEQEIKKETYGQQLQDLISAKLDVPASGPLRVQIFNDSFTLSQASKQLYPASNQQIQIQLKMDNAIISCKRSYLFGQAWVQGGGVIPDFRNIFELIQLNLGAGVTDTLSYNSFYRALQRCRKGKSSITDMSACQKVDDYPIQYGSFDAYTQTSGEPTIFVGSGAAANVSTTPYQLHGRQIVANYLEHATGNFINNGGQQYQLVNFAVSLADLSEVLEEQDLVLLALGQQLKMVLRTQPDGNVVMNAFQTASGAIAQPQYGLNNLSLCVQYFDLSDQDLDRILQSNIEMKIPASIPFTQAQCPAVYQANHSISIGDRLDSLIIGCFPNYSPSAVTLDTANVASNLLGPGVTGQTGIMPLQTSKLNFSVLPPIQLITLMYGSRQVTINNQQIAGMTVFVDLDGRPWTQESKLGQGIKNALCIDLRRFFNDEIGSFPGASSSLLVSVTFQTSTNTGSSNPTQLRTLAYQTQDWSLQALSNLQIFSFARVIRKGLIQRGIYQMTV